MRTSPFSPARISLVCIGLIGFIAAVGTGPAHAVLQARRNVPPATGYITGVARSDKGPEAGVWVIAETKDLLTNFIKIVVTDDQGRFMLPELPNANYNVWVRGFGLVDSPKIQMQPGTNSVALKAISAKTPQEAAQVYPGNY